MNNTRPSQSQFAGELRDTERLIALWHQNATEGGGLPSLRVFDFSRMNGGDGACRFVIAADPVGGAHTFLIYGSQFARLLELPERPVFGATLADQLPGRYLSLFTEGCAEAIGQAQPIKMSGFTVHFGQTELYRAAFLPLVVWPKYPVRFILGTFNSRIGARTSAADCVRLTYQFLYEAQGWLTM